MNIPTRKQTDSNDSSSSAFISTIDKKGRICIPADLRKTFSLISGTQVEIDFSVLGTELVMKFQL